MPLHLLRQQADLRLRLLPRALVLAPLRLQLLLLPAQRLQVAPERFRVAAHALEVRLEHADGLGDVAALGLDAVALGFCAVQLVRLIGERAAEILDLEEVEVELVTAAVVGGL